MLLLVCDFVMTNSDTYGRLFAGILALSDLTHLGIMGNDLCRNVLYGLFVAEMNGTNDFCRTVLQEF